jgi:hypothetical protein
VEVASSKYHTTPKGHLKRCLTLAALVGCLFFSVGIGLDLVSSSPADSMSMTGFDAVLVFRKF